MNELKPWNEYATLPLMPYKSFVNKQISVIFASFQEGYDNIVSKIK